MEAASQGDEHMRHRDQVLALLQQQIGNPNEVRDIRETAEAVVRKWVDARAPGKLQINGLIYGLVQSGKTGALTVTGAMGADSGYAVILILTSDIDPLYKQTLQRVRESFPGIDVLAKNDFRDVEAFNKRIKSGVCAIVSTKNGRMLHTLIDNFRKGRFKNLSCLIIDDEADQASLNTKTSKDDGSRSAVNEKIADLRGLFERNTYLQVTATPQALFLQTPGHDFRPQFTVLSRSGADYVGGEDFFSDGSTLVKEFDLSDIGDLVQGGQPSPTLKIPDSLLRALDIFMVGGAFKRSKDADQNCAFLCHVSTKTADHKHIVDLLLKYKSDLPAGIKAKSPAVIKRLMTAYNELASTHPGVRNSKFEDLLNAVEFFSPGAHVKLVNGESDDDVAVNSPYNLFVGGNKLGRGVTIKNLLVSYYGRNPKKPQADTVLQHARMYGYRRKDIGLLRLFLPQELHTVFKAINKMERGLRELIERTPAEQFRGVYVESGLSPTRRNVLVPGALGFYSGGSNYNPAQILRGDSTKDHTAKIDDRLKLVANRSTIRMSIDSLRELILLTQADPSASERIWNPIAVAESVVQFASLRELTQGYVYVDRERGLESNRAETAGILSGGEYKVVPPDQLALFMLKTRAAGSDHAAW
jgi:hypothetical protein